MIRLRDQSGAPHPLPRGMRFVEVCDPEGRLAALVFYTDDGAVRYLEAGSPDIARYCSLMGVEQIENKVALG